MKQTRGSSAGDDFDDFQPVADGQHPPGKFAGSNGMAVVLDDNRAGRKFLRDQKNFN